MNILGLLGRGGLAGSNGPDRLVSQDNTGPVGNLKSNTIINISKLPIDLENPESLVAIQLDMSTTEKTTNGEISNLEPLSWT